MREEEYMRLSSLWLDVVNDLFEIIDEKEYEIVKLQAKVKLLEEENERLRECKR